MNKDELDNNAYSTWENRLTDRMLPPPTLEKYYTVLKIINYILIGSITITSLVIVYMVIKFVFFQDYDFFLFVDGTELSCILNPKTGEISQND